MGQQGQQKMRTGRPAHQGKNPKKRCRPMIHRFSSFQQATKQQQRKILYAHTLESISKRPNPVLLTFQSDSEIIEPEQ